jgi:hypothetical protein
MTVTKPYYRTARQFVDDGYSEGGRSQYIRHPSYADEPSNYVRAFLLIQKDLQVLFEYIEPADQNISTYSFRTHELLLRTCMEIEANFKAILRANIYSPPSRSWNIIDYAKIDKSHYLSDYTVKVPYWKGGSGIRRPFADWKSGHGLSWYQAYNASKHDRAQELKAATFDAVIDAYCGLSVVLTAQFLFYDFVPANDVLTAEGIGDGLEEGIGQYVRLKYPSNVPPADRYDFKWENIRNTSDPFQKFNYDAV